jgi:hypothetical protein
MKRTPDNAPEYAQYHERPMDSGHKDDEAMNKTYWHGRCVKNNCLVFPDHYADKETTENGWQPRFTNYRRD